MKPNNNNNNLPLWIRGLGAVVFLCWAGILFCLGAVVLHFILKVW